MKRKPSCRARRSELEQVDARVGAIDARARAGAQPSSGRVDARARERSAARARGRRSGEAEAARCAPRSTRTPAVAPELTDEARESAPRRRRCSAADAAARAKPTSEASRWRARAEMLALALDEAHAAAGGEALADVDGVIGPLVDHLEIDDGCRGRGRRRAR